MPFYGVAAEPDSTGLADADSWALNDSSDSAIEEVTAKQALTYMWGQMVAAGATLTLSAASHAGKVVLLDTAAGSIVTLPQATGTGNIYRFKIKVIATTNSHIVKVGNATDVIQGLVFSLSDGSNAVVGWAATATDDTITLNRSTTGSLSIGEFIELQDIVTGKFTCHGMTQSNGTEATPFSATV